MAELPLAQALRHSEWLYPLVEVVHIAGIALLVGSVWVFDLRVLGLGQAPIRQLARATLPWSVAALLLIVPSGLLLFVADAQALLGNRAFLLKMLLLAAAGANAAAFHLALSGHVRRAGETAQLSAGLRAHAAASLLLWLAIIGCGRMIAYV
jgi:hypothetical protein